MKKLTAVLGLLSILLLLLAYAYSNQPHETMSSLYQKIPEQVRENAQLIAAYYSSQNGDREYQFAFYDPKERTLSIYTFKISNFLKIFWDKEENKITCETPFNYSVLATSPEKLKNFENCDNCKLFLYKGRIYKNKEIESIYPSIEQVIKENTTYVNFVLLKDEELSIGGIIERHGDMGLGPAYFGYKGLLHLPTTMHNPSRGVIVEFIAKNDTIHVVIHYPKNMTFSTISSVRLRKDWNSTWNLKEVPLSEILQKSKSKELSQEIKGSLRFEFSITKRDNRAEAWASWINSRKQAHGYWRLYPPDKIEWRRFTCIEKSCRWTEENIFDPFP
ncbi:hypothetical protein [Thermococcus gammatolerans]|nr:hypothetical protein [Thermococcus gammatolerans]